MPYHPAYRVEAYEGQCCLVPGLVHCGHGAAKRALRGGYPSERHDDCYELLLIVQGSAEWWTERSRFKISGGQMAILQPGEEHGGVDDVMHRCEISWAIFKPAAGRIANLSRAQTSRTLAACAALPPVITANQRIEEAFDRLLEEHRQPDALSPTIAGAAVVDLLARVGRSGSAQPIDARIRRALDWVETNSDRPVSVAEFARAAGLGMSIFRQRFAAVMKESPAAWLLARRIDRARRLLRNTDRTVLSIALDCGFSTSQHFATAFQRLLGMTPSRYRGNH
jgi:AraC-like DNA-binding protein